MYFSKRFGRCQLAAVRQLPPKDDRSWDYEVTIEETDRKRKRRRTLVVGAKTLFTFSAFRNAVIRQTGGNFWPKGWGSRGVDWLDLISAALVVSREVAA